MVVVSVLGAGVFGSRVAGELAMCGHLVRVCDLDMDILNRLPEQLQFERDQSADVGISTSGQVLGEVAIFTDLEEAVRGAEIVVEAVLEDLEVKQELMERLSKIVTKTTVIVTSSLRLDLDLVFSKLEEPHRSMGLRFLFPVYSIPEVELRTWECTSRQTVVRVTDWLEKMGKTAFLRSGPEPLILTEEEREKRLCDRLDQVRRNRGLGGRVVTHLPQLAHLGNFSPAQDDQTSFSLHSCVERECIICMDGERSCLLSPCHHLATCQDCGEMLLVRKDSCPVCRTNITDIINFYRS